MNIFRIATILISMAIVTTNAIGDEPWFQRRVTERYPLEVRTILLPVASEKAKALFQDEIAQWEYIYAYIWGYLYGLENTPGMMSIGKSGDPLQTGFDTGTRDYKDQFSITNQSLDLLDFGYEPITATGTFEAGFENSNFRPDGTEENWWVKFQVGVRKHFAKKRSLGRYSLFTNPRPCTFKGFLAPKTLGGTGHMNQYDRDFIVTEIIEVGPEPSTKDVIVEIQ